METIVGNVAIDVPPGVAVKTSKDGETVTLDFEGSGFNGTLSLRRLVEKVVKSTGKVVGIVREEEKAKASEPEAPAKPVVAATEPVVEVVEPKAPAAPAKEVAVAKPATPEPAAPAEQAAAPAAKPPAKPVIDLAKPAVPPPSLETLRRMKQTEASKPKPLKRKQLSLSKPKKQLRMSEMFGMSIDLPKTTNGAEHAYQKVGVKDMWQSHRPSPAEGGGPCPARCGATACLATSKNQVCVSGGLGDAGYMSDLWILDTESWQWNKGGSNGFRERAWHTCSPIEDKGLLVFGGQCDKPKEDQEDEDDDTLIMGDLVMYDFDSSVWFPVTTTGDAPYNRSGHTATVLGGGKKVVIFGGMNEDGKFLNDVHVLDTAIFSWSKPSTKGSPIKARAYHTAILVGQKILFFGGIGKCNWAFKEIYSLDTETWKWSEHSRNVQGEAPCKRVGQVATPLDERRVLIHGGHSPEDPGECYDDAYVLDTQTWMWMHVAAGEVKPTRRAGHCGCAVNGTLAIFSGQDQREAKINDGVWKMDLNLINI